MIGTQVFCVEPNLQNQIQQQKAAIITMATDLLNIVNVKLTTQEQLNETDPRLVNFQALLLNLIENQNGIFNDPVVLSDVSLVFSEKLKCKEDDCGIAATYGGPYGSQDYHAEFYSFPNKIKELEKLLAQRIPEEMGDGNFYPQIPQQQQQQRRHWYEFFACNKKK